MTNESHLPVLAAESVDGLNIKSDGIYVDCTFGRGGHSRMLMNVLGPNGKLLAFDKDVEAINSSQAQGLSGDKRFELVHSSFSRLAEEIDARGWAGQVDGILMDLGVSSPQLDEAHRGFSFLRDGPLDMRMDSSQGESAAEWLAKISIDELIRILRVFGEERFARRIAEAVVQKRNEEGITRTAQLASLIDAAVPVKDKHKHPATRSFQAIRIAVNGELDDLEAVLPQSSNVLKPGGRLAVISFHSLEDRIVKRFIRDQSRGPKVPKGLPLRDELIQPPMKRVSKAIRAGEGEVKQNPRARSAILRIAEKVG